MLQLSQQFVEGLFFAICQKQPTNSDIASVMAHAKSAKDAVSIIRKLPKAEGFFNQFHGLSCNWMDHLLCIGQQPTYFQASMLAFAGINRFVDCTETVQDYFEILPENISYYKTPILNNEQNKPEPVEAAARAVLDPLARNERVYVHCQSGFCRSAIIASVVTAVRLNIPYCEGVKIVKLRRPVAQPQSELLTREDAEAVIGRLRK